MPLPGNKIYTDTENLKVSIHSALIVYSIVYIH